MLEPQSLTSLFKYKIIIWNSFWSTCKGDCSLLPWHRLSNTRKLTKKMLWQLIQGKSHTGNEMHFFVHYYIIKYFKAKNYKKGIFNKTVNTLLYNSWLKMSPKRQQMRVSFDYVTVSSILVKFHSMKILPTYSIQYILNATQYMQLICILFLNWNFKFSES